MGRVFAKKFAYNFTLYYDFPFLTEHKHCNIPITSRKDSRFMKTLDTKTATGSDKILVVHFKNISPELYQMLEKCLTATWKILPKSMEGVRCKSCFQQCGWTFILISISTHQHPEFHQQTQLVDHLNGDNFNTDFALLGTRLISCHNAQNQWGIRRQIHHRGDISNALGQGVATQALELWNHWKCFLTYEVLPNRRF